MRTTPEEVAQIIEVAGDIDLHPFITIANMLVTEHCTDLDSLRQIEVEKWLAAHFYETRDELPTSESAGGASRAYQRNTGMYLNQTKYGQTAILLDSSGALNKIGIPKAKAVWLGTEE